MAAAAETQDPFVLSVEGVVTGIVSVIVDNPDDVRVEATPRDADDPYSTVDVALWTNANDVPLVIGKGGNMISSIRSVLAGASGRSRREFLLEYKSERRYERG
jgi:predicted RNA-binding protein YlqC (UPF0109 family)